VQSTFASFLVQLTQRVISFLHFFILEIIIIVWRCTNYWSFRGGGGLHVWRLSWTRMYLELSFDVPWLETSPARLSLGMSLYLYMFHQLKWLEPLPRFVGAFASQRMGAWTVSASSGPSHDTPWVRQCHTISFGNFRPFVNFPFHFSWTSRTKK